MVGWIRVVPRVGYSKSPPPVTRELDTAKSTKPCTSSTHGLAGGALTAMSAAKAAVPNPVTPTASAPAKQMDAIRLTPILVLLFDPKKRPDSKLPSGGVSYRS